MTNPYYARTFASDGREIDEAEAETEEAAIRAASVLLADLSDRDLGAWASVYRVAPVGETADHLIYTTRDGRPR